MIDIQRKALFFRGFNFSFCWFCLLHSLWFFLHFSRIFSLLYFFLFSDLFFLFHIFQKFDFVKFELSWAIDGSTLEIVWNLFNYLCLDDYALHIVIDVIIWVPVRVWLAQDLLCLFPGLFQSFKKLSGMQYQGIIQQFRVLLLRHFTLSGEKFREFFEKLLDAFG